MSRPLVATAWAFEPSQSEIDTLRVLPACFTKARRPLAKGPDSRV